MAAIHSFSERVKTLFVYTVLSGLMFTSTAYAADGDFLWQRNAAGVNFAPIVSDTFALSDGGYMRTGTFQGSQIFGEGGSNSITLVSRGRPDIFVARYTSDSDLVWAVSAGGDSWDTVNEIACSALDECYVTGTFSNTAVFGTGGSETSVSASAGDRFLAKFNGNGGFAWVRQTRSADRGNPVRQDGVAVAEDGTVIVVGAFEYTASFATNTTSSRSLISMGQSDAFLARYSANGLLLDIEQEGGSAFDSATDVAICGGAVYVVGNLGTVDGRNRAEFGREVIFVTRPSTYLIRYNASFDLQWLRYAEPTGGGSVSGNSVACSSVPGVVVSDGRLYGEAGFGYDNPMRLYRNSGDRYDVYVQKYDANGAMLWVEQGIGQSFVNPGEVTMSSDGGIVMTGQFFESVTFGTGPSRRILRATGRQYDIYVAKYLPGGVLHWAYNAGGGPLNDFGSRLTVLWDDSLLISGYISSPWTTVTFKDFGMGRFDSAVSSSDGYFLAKYGNIGDFRWIEYSGPSNGNEGSDVAPFTDGSALVVGTFYRQMVIGNSEEGMTTLNTGSKSGFLAKYGPTGRLLLAKQEGASIKAAATFPDNSFVVAGKFIGSTTFGAGESNEVSFFERGSEDIFIAKYRSDGSLEWARVAGSTTTDEIYDISVMLDGSMIVSGMYSAGGGGITFEGDGGMTLAPIGGNDIFLAKYRPDGSLEWTKSAGGADGNDFARSVAVYPDGSFVLAGDFNGHATFGRGEPLQTVLASVNNRSDIFVARYRADGTLVWAKRAGGEDADYGYGVTALGAGASAVTGHFRNSMVLGGGESSAITLFSAGGSDIFVAKYAVNGRIAWAKRAGGTGDDSGRSIAGLASDGDVTVVSGYYSEQATFGDGGSTFTLEPIRASTHEHLQDVFVVKYNASGQPVWANAATGANANDFSTAAAAYPGGTSVITGQFGSMSDADRSVETSMEAVFGDIMSGTVASVPIYSGGMFLAQYDAILPTSYIKGRVRDRVTGRSLPNVTVTLSGGTTSSTQTNSIGEYLFSGLGRLSAYTVTVPDFGDYFFTTRESSDNFYHYENLYVSRANQDFIGGETLKRISGKITGAQTGLPMGSVVVRLAGAVSLTTATDASGNYSFENLRRGIYQLYAPATVSTVFVTQTTGASSYRYDPLARDQVNQNFIAVPRLYSIKGKVTLSGRGGLPVIRVKLTDGTGSVREVLTNTVGDYLFFDLPIGSYEMTVEDQLGYTFVTKNMTDSYVYATLSSHLGSQNFLATIDPSVSRYNIGGRAVRDAALGGTPLSNVRIMLWYMDQGAKDNANAWISTLTDASGYYKFSGLVQGGDYTVMPLMKTDIGMAFTPAKIIYLDLDGDRINQNFSFGMLR